MKGVTAFCWCGRSQRGNSLHSGSKWIILTILILDKKSFMHSHSPLYLMLWSTCCTCACIFLSVLVSPCISLSLCLPSSLRLFYSLLSGSVTHVAGGQGERGVSPGSKIYEQLKDGRRPASISPACCCQAGWGGLAVNHRLYTFISVFPPKREGYDKIMFYCPQFLARCRHLSRNRLVGGQSPWKGGREREICVCKSVCCVYVGWFFFLTGDRSL